jgi:hypothetical protein
VRPRLGILIGVAMVATIVVGTAVGVGAKEPSGLDSLPAFSAAQPSLELVGDAGGLRLGVSIVSDTEAIAYLCDGESVGVWFTGTVDLDSGDVSLESADGGTVTLNLNSDPVVATAVVDGETTAFTLAPVTHYGGVARFVTKAKGHQWTTGWIVADDGTIVGLTSDESGKPVAGVNASTPVPQSLQTDPPVTTGAVRCAILAARISNQIGKAGKAQAAGDADGVAEHNGFANGLGGRASGADCSGFHNNA